jgi:hypothetical protein
MMHLACAGAGCSGTGPPEPRRVRLYCVHTQESNSNPAACEIAVSRTWLVTGKSIDGRGGQLAQLLPTCSCCWGAELRVIM